MNQKGLSTLAIVLLIGAAFIGGYFLYGQMNLSPKTVQPTIQSSPTPDETTNWKTYTNNQLKINLKYPPEWKEVKDCRGSGSGICFQSPEFDPTEGDFIAGTNKGIVLTISTDSGNINKIADIHCEERNSYYPNSCFYSTINDKSTLHLKGGVKEADKLIVTSELLYIQVEPNKITKIGFFNTQKDAENQRKIFDQILSTFKILP